MMYLLKADEQPYEQLCPGVNVREFCASRSQERYRGTTFSVEELRNKTIKWDSTSSKLRNVAQRADAIVFLFDVELSEVCNVTDTLHPSMASRMSLRWLLEWVLESAAGDGCSPHPPPLLALAVSSTGDVISLEDTASLIGLAPRLHTSRFPDKVEVHQEARQAICEGAGTLYCDWRCVVISGREAQDAMHSGFGWLLSR